MWHASTHCMLARHLSHWEFCSHYLLLNPFYCFHHFRWTSVERRIGLCRGTSGPSSRPSWPIPMMTPPPKLGSETVGHAPYATFCKHVIIIINYQLSMYESFVLLPTFVIVNYLFETIHCYGCLYRSFSVIFAFWRLFLHDTSVCYDEGCAKPVISWGTLSDLVQVFFVHCTHFLQESFWTKK